MIYVRVDRLKNRATRICQNTISEKKNIDNNYVQLCICIQLMKMIGIAYKKQKILNPCAIRTSKRCQKIVRLEEKKRSIYWEKKLKNKVIILFLNVNKTREIGVALTLYSRDGEKTISMLLFFILVIRIIMIASGVVT